MSYVIKKDSWMEIVYKLVRLRYNVLISIIMYIKVYFLDIIKINNKIHAI